MSYAVGAALQSAVYQRLIADAALDALVDGDIYDAMPSGTLPSLFVSLGPEIVKDRSDNDGHGAEHDFIISVVTQAAGFQQAKQAAAAVSDAVVDSDLTLTRGRLVALNFLRAVAVREGTGDVRRIDLRFRVRVEDN